MYDFEKVFNKFFCKSNHNGVNNDRKFKRAANFHSQTTALGKIFKKIRVFVMKSQKKSNTD